MSHGSGIVVSKQLTESFGSNLTSNQYRIFKVEIQNETELVDVASHPVSGDWEQDFSSVVGLLEATEPCFVLYRLDSQNNLGFEWVLITYVPDKAKVRQKMVYSATKASLKMSLGGGRFAQEIHATTPSDLSLDSYKKYIAHQQAEAPLTRAEIDRKEEEEQGVFVGGGGTGSAANSGVAFPVDSEVTSALASLKSGKITYVGVVVNVQAERIQLGSTSNVSIYEVGQSVPIDEPRFHFFNWNHVHDGETLNSVVFVYSCPDGSGGTKSAPVRQRMLYSASKSHAIDIGVKAGLEIAGKFEINNSGELTEQLLANEIHPKPVAKKEAFARPKAAGRGPRKLTGRE
jgi:twinfilin-like protein